MATYPGGVKTFTAKQDGIDYPQASHINDLQAEVTAVEDALINGISHAVTLEAGLTVSTGPVVVGQSLSVAGGSTLAGAVVISSGLSVAGGSTLASLDVAGNSTFHGPVTFSSGVTFAQALTLNGTLDVGSTLTLAGPLRLPIQSTAVGGASTSVNELVIASSAVVVVIDVNSSNFAIGGIAGGVQGRMLTVINGSASGSLTLVNQNGGTNSTSRFWGVKTLSTSARVAQLVYVNLTFGGLTPGWVVS